MNYRNYVELEGFLGDNAVQKLTPSGKSLTILSLAVRQSWQKDGAWESRTDWFRIVAWNGVAETAANLKKGAHVRLEGRLSTGVYDGPNGKVRSVEVIAFQIEETPRQEKREAAAETDAPAASRSEPSVDPIPAERTPVEEPTSRKRSRKSTQGETA